MKTWTCKLVAPTSVMVSPETRLAHLKRYALEICGVRLEEVQEVESDTRAKGRKQGQVFPWESEVGR